MIAGVSLALSLILIAVFLTIALIILDTIDNDSNWKL
jgi:hypothetical protein